MKLKRAAIDILRKTHLIALANRINNKYYAMKKRKALKAGTSPIDAVYDDAFFKQNAQLTKSSIETVTRTIVERTHPASVVDFGCGTGRYLKPFQDQGIDIYGVDGSTHAKANSIIPDDKLLVADLTKPLDLNRRFDVAICFEVAEHIPTAASEELVKTVTRHADTVFFTAAPPGQGGTDHINEQPPAFWITLFDNHGFDYDAATTDTIRDTFKKEDVLWWVTANIMVFTKKASA